MSRQIVENIKQLQEKNLFMKGILSWVGANKVEIVEYERKKRVAGETKFNWWKLWNLALEGITNFSTVPLRVWTYMGMSISAMTFIYALILIIRKVAFGNPVSGYSSIMVSILFLGGIQLIGIGVLGEYIGRIYLETKNRPRYIVKQKK
jgi:glycosyltransferase involved in cell wall biosynthesis